MTEQEKAERLARFLEQPERCSDGETVGLIEVANRLSASETPDPTFVASLRADLLRKHPSAGEYGENLSDVNGTGGRARGIDRRGGWLRRLRMGRLAWIASVLALILAGIGIFLRPVPDVDAREVVSRMKQSAQSMQVDRYRATVVHWGVGKDGTPYRSVSKRWYEEPGRFRQETTYSLPRSFRRTVVVAGGRFWSSDSRDTVVWIDAVSQSAVSRLAGPYMGADQLGDLLQSPSDQYDVRLTGLETVAGRRCYELELSVRDRRITDEVTRMRVWVDRETFYALKVEAYDSRNRLRFGQETKEIAYNPPMDPALFQPGNPGAPSFEEKEETTLGEVPLKIRFASTGIEYRRGERVSFRLTLENVGDRPIRLGDQKARLSVGDLKEGQGVWEQELDALAGVTIRPGKSVQAIATWRVDVPPGKYMVFLRGLTYSENGEPKTQDVGLGLFFVP